MRDPKRHKQLRHHRFKRPRPDRHIDRSLRFWSIGLKSKRMVRQKAFVLRPVDFRQVSHSVIAKGRPLRLDKRRPGERWQGAPHALRGPTRHKQLRHHRFTRPRPVDFRQVSTLRFGQPNDSTETCRFSTGLCDLCVAHPPFAPETRTTQTQRPAGFPQVVTAPCSRRSTRLKLPTPRSSAAWHSAKATGQTATC